LDAKITNNQRRTLVLVAKVLQNLANDQTFYGKEAYMKGMNTFLNNTKLSLYSYFHSLIQVGEPQNYLGYLKSEQSRIERTVVISPEELFFLFKLIKDNKEQLSLNKDDPMYEILQNTSTSPEMIPKNGTMPTVLKVQSLEDSELTENQLIIQPLKQKLVTLLSRSTIEFSPDDKNFMELISSLRKEGDKVAPLVEEVLGQLENVPLQYKEIEYNLLQKELEDDYERRIQHYEYSLMDKIELLQAIEQHKRELHALTEEKALYFDYLQNARKLSSIPSFRSWYRMKGNNSKPPIVAFSKNSVLTEDGSVQKFE